MSEQRSHPDDDDERGAREHAQSNRFLHKYILLAVHHKQRMIGVPGSIPVPGTSIIHIRPVNIITLLLPGLIVIHKARTEPQHQIIEYNRLPW